MRALGTAQQGLWSGYLLNEDRAMFNTAECIAFDGKIHAATLITAVQQAVRECEALSGVLVAEKDTAFFNPCNLPVDVRQVQVPAAEGGEEWVRDWAMRDIREPIDLESELPCRFVLLQAEGRDFLYSCVHHIALDGYGTNLLYQRIAELYGAALNGDPPPRNGFGRYEDVLKEDAERDAQGRTAAARGYWLEALSRMPEPASFSERSAPISATFIRHGAPFTEPLWQALNQVADAHGVSWPDLLLAGISAHLRQVSEVRSQVLGLMVMNRVGSASFNVPCMQMNIAPLCVDLPDDADLIVSAKALGKLRRSSRKHQHYRYESLRRDLGRVGGEQRLFGPLINIMPFDRPLAYGDCPARTLNLSAGPVEDLTLEVQIGADGMPVLDYDANPGCYSLDQVRSLQQELFDLLECWLAEPQQPRAVLLEELFAVRRAWQVLKSPGSATHALPTNVLEAIRLQAQTQPRHIALVQQEQRLSYGELQARAEMVAAALVNEGIGPGQRVGVMLSRSPQAILAQLGVLLAGAVYVPLDPEQPADRQRLICETADLALVITEAAYRHRLADIHSGPIQLIGLLTSANRIYGPRSDDAGCYVMFTSGSTGAPKGVEVSHRALVHFAHAARQRYGIGSADRVLQFAPFNFDASIEEVFVSLSAGATLVLRSDPMLQSMSSFVEGLEELAISVVDLPTAFWNEWVVALRSGQVQIPASLKTVIIGGEAVYPEQLQAWQRVGRRDLRLINTYGPTETTVVATSGDLQCLDPHRERLPIGQPLAGVEALVLARGNRPGSEGELVLFGPQLANGYLNSDSPAFAHLRIGDETMRVYRTGDRVQLIDGQLVYLGRLDNEFKISGYRIQPGEVEARMLALPGIDEACVLGLELDGGVRRLVAFHAGPWDDARAIKRALGAVLPGAMVPTDYRHFAVLPRTGSNKIDRKRLQQAYVQDSSDRVLNDETQRRVSTIWQQILGVSGIQPDDNFFELGGQSLQTIQIVNRLGAEFGTAVKVSDVFDHPQLADFCSFLDSRLQQREALVEMVW
ncbi:amino acid adenylation domain-containing protein [Stutzerimonas chloritidismutans]|uniref:Amino acid adenylation domain-containing protein n=1 Tax=Stutzerimonas chloritidismutans TaxID=203192 RepID=A0ABU9M890_STUCH